MSLIRTNAAKAANIVIEDKIWDAFTNINNTVIGDWYIVKGLTGLTFTGATVIKQSVESAASGNACIFILEATATGITISGTGLDCISGFHLSGDLDAITFE